MYLVHIYAYPYKYTYIQVLMAQNSCISQPYSPCWRTTRPGTWLLHKPRSFSNALSSAKRWPTLCDKCLDSVLHFTPTGIFTLKLRLWQAWSSCEQLKASLQFFALRQLTTACRTVSLCWPSSETPLNPSLNSTTALNQGQDPP